MLTAAQLAARENKLTASRVACLMTGDQAKIMNLWYEMVGDPRHVPDPDLTWVWAPRLGSHTEALNLDWYEHKTGHSVTRRGEVVIHPLDPWAACTLDGWDNELRCPIEAKHVGGREPLSKIVDRYAPQTTWQMIVTETTEAILSVIEGANEPIVEHISLDPDYAVELWRRAEAFWQCVENLVPPFNVPPVAPPIKAERIVDMSTSNSWASEATAWREHINSKRIAEKAEKELKLLTPEDAMRCYGHGVQVSRDRAGRLSLREFVS